MFPTHFVYWKRKMKIYKQDGKYIASYPLENFLNQSIKVLPQIRELRIRFSSRNFGYEMNLKDLLYLVLFRFSTV